MRKGAGSANVHPGGDLVSYPCFTSDIDTLAWIFRGLLEAVVVGPGSSIVRQFESIRH